jgi:uncharacterized small protein (TIGR04563 family)
MAEQNEKRKQSLYFPEDMLQEIQEAATRQDRSLSWIIQQAWRIARTKIASIPGMNEPTPPAT